MDLLIKSSSNHPKCPDSTTLTEASTLATHVWLEQRMEIFDYTFATICNDVRVIDYYVSLKRGKNISRKTMIFVVLSTNIGQEFALDDPIVNEVETVSCLRMDLMLRLQPELSQLTPKVRRKLVARNSPMLDTLTYVRFLSMPTIQDQVRL